MCVGWLGGPIRHLAECSIDVEFAHFPPLTHLHILNLDKPFSVKSDGRGPVAIANENEATSPYWDILVCAGIVQYGAEQNRGGVTWEGG